MKDRLNLFLTMEGISASEFAKEMGIQRSGISHLLAGRNKPSYEFISTMLSHYPKLNAEWLLLGIGKPYKDSDNSPARFIPEPEPTHAPVSEQEHESTYKSEPEQVNPTPTTTEAPESKAEYDLFSPIPQPKQLTVEETVEPVAPPAQPSENRIIYPQPVQQPPISQPRAIKEIIILYTDGTFEIR